VAFALLQDCGFRVVDASVALPGGVEVSFRGYDRHNGAWFFDVTGGFTSTRPGLRRTDTLWKALGKAAVLREVAPRTPLILLTTEKPAPGSAGAAALAAVCGRDKPVLDVIQMTEPDDQDRLLRYALGIRRRRRLSS
jgi:site-specific DNA-methyltransferase (adenine-specific)